MSPRIIRVLLLAFLMGCGGASAGPHETTPEISLGPAPDPHPASPKVERAESLLASNHPAEAASLLEEATAETPSDPRAHLTLGIARSLLGDAAGAEAAFRASIERDPSYAEAHNELGLLLRDTGRLPDAIAALRRSVEARVDFWDGWYNLALALEDGGDLPGADEAYGQAVRGLGNDPVVRFHRAGLYLRTNRADDARRELARARELASGRVDVLRAIARSFARAGDATESFETLERAVRAGTAPDVDLLIEAAGSARSARRLDRALDLARRAVAVDATSARAQAMLALVASDSNRRDEARTAIARAIELDTDGSLREDLDRLRARIEAMSGSTP